MANMYFIGEDAAFTEAVQVDTFTPANVEVDDVFTLTITGEDGSTASVSFTATEATAANVAAGLVAAWNASTDPLMTGITASGTETVVLTADTAGVPFNVASSTTNGGANDTQTLAREATTANAGYSDWETQANWDGGDGDLPGADASDSIFIDGGQDENAILYGLDQSAISNALTLLDVTRIQIGQNPGITGMPFYLGIKSAVIDINKTPAVGSPTFRQPVNISSGATASVITVHDGSTNLDDPTEPGVNLKAASASTKMYVKKGNVGIASHAGETATVGEIHAEGGKTVIGSGVTLTTLYQKGGDCVCRCGAATVDVTRGNLTTEGSGAITTKLINRGGTVVSNSSGTIAEVNALAGITDFTQSNVARTVTLLKIAAGAIVKYDPAVVTVTTLQVYDTAGNIQMEVRKA